MSALDDVAKAIGDAVGVVGGGPSQVKATLGFASLRQSLLDKTKSLGATLGAYTGADFANSFAAGAAPAASAARASTLGQLTGVTADPTTLLYLGGAAILALAFYLGLRGRK